MRTRINPLRKKGPLRSPEQIRADTKERIAHYIKRRRTELGILQQDLSINLARAPKYIWRIENGHSEIDLFEFIEITEALGDKPEEVMRELI